MSRLTMPEKLADMQRMSTWNAIFLLVALLLAPGCDGVTQAPQTPPGPDRAGSPSWSPDGSMIAFTGLKGATSKIYYLLSSGGGYQRLTTSGAGVHESKPAWGGFLR